MKTPILGGSYLARYKNPTSHRMINLFPEAIPEGGENAAYLQRAPGLSFLARVGAGPIRGLWAVKDRLFVVSGSELYVTNNTFVPAFVGKITGTGRVSITDNGTQVMFACNPDGFIYNLVKNTFNQITDPDFPGAKTVGYLDGYFVFNQPNTQLLWVSDLGDGTQYNALEFVSAEGNPDNIVGIVVDHREIWVFGSNSTEVWYNAANPPPGSPLSRIEGAFNEFGCHSANTIAKMDNSVFWLGRDTRGNGMVYRANGYQAKRVSTHAVEWSIQQAGNLDDASAFTYQQDGHSFYCLSVPGWETTWCYDAATELWSERAAWVNGLWSRHQANTQANLGNKTVVGDHQNGNLYALDLAVQTDNGMPQRWLRTWPALAPDNQNYTRTQQHELRLICRSGTGNTQDPASEPVVLLRWSDDSGNTWSTERPASLGRQGDFGKRVLWRRLGLTTRLRDRVYEVSGADPVVVAIEGAEINVGGTRA